MDTNEPDPRKLAPTLMDLDKPMKNDKLRRALVAEYVRGGDHVSLAKRLSKGDQALKKRLNERLRRMGRTDIRLFAMIHEEAHAMAQAGLIPAMEGLIDRASKGKPDAIKPIFELTNFHNPKKQVEHSGEIKISMDMPRPGSAQIPQETENEDVIDAEVVEDEKSGRDG